MSLHLKSNDRMFDAYIADFQTDKAISPLESIKIRNSADTEMDTLLASLKSHVNDVLKKEQKPELDWPLKRLQMSADMLVEDLQFLAKLMRNSNLQQDTIDSIRTAIEHQLVYVVFAHNASIDRVKAFKKSG